MKIDKAIEVLTDFLAQVEYTKDTNTYKAIKLGAEALKRVNLQRTHGGVITDVFLPGETKE